jgi:phospholipid-binding lipoprotein MlaA
MKKTKKTKKTKKIIRLGVLCMLLVLNGCTALHRNPQDPLESFNRAMFNFNDTVDKTALKPAATVYKALMPPFVQTAIGNFFGNIGDAWTAVNNLMQGKLTDGMSDVMRVAINTTLGWGGLLDIGSEAGLVKHKEDFGQTLGKWGVRSGPYVVLPLLGSTTLRDVAALPVDITADPWSYAYPVSVRNTGVVLRVLDIRASVLDASNLIEEAAIDKYEFIRDAYLQRRESKIHDGDEPDSRPTDENDAPALSPQSSVGLTEDMPISAPAQISILPVSSDTVTEQLTRTTASVTQP